MGRTVFKTVAMVVAVFILIQLVPVERTNPPVAGEIQAPAPVMQILETSCYDCHSNETKWPWYSQVAPLSWVVSKHVREGREHLNFSDWEAMIEEDREHAREEIWEEVEMGAMPLRGYLRWHPAAQLTSDHLAILEDWAKAVDPRFSGTEAGVRAGSPDPPPR